MRRYLTKTIVFLSIFLCAIGLTQSDVLQNGVDNTIVTVYAEEDDGFGRVERHKVGAGRAKHLAREVKDVERDGVALLSSLEHVVRSDLIGVKLTQGTVFGAF